MAGSESGSGANTNEKRVWYWRREEDERLMELIQEQGGPGKWKHLASHMNGRTALSCRLRWKNHLNPEVDTSPLTGEERARLLQLQKVHGNKWSTIVPFFPHRTETQLKSHYNSMRATLGRTLVYDPSTSRVV